jgi:hypothetical protein
MSRKEYAVNRNTYKEYARETEGRYEQEARGRADLNRLSSLARGIANIYAEFGDIEPARLWFARALDLHRQRRKDPNTLAAQMLWRMGDQLGLEEECRAAIAYHNQRTEELRPQFVAATDQTRYETKRVLGLAYHQVVGAHLYLRDFKGAVVVASRAIAEAPFGHETPIMHDLAAAIEKRDQGSYEAALRNSRARVHNWPTFESDSAIDLYRLALAYGREYFGSIPADLEQELSALH